ncbi:MAG: ATP-binding protein, partial [Clostridiales bacterium]|nr:ATP-binding protein [Clostridiales bacterium]
LIIDEVGHCEFDKENTRLFFDMIDRRYNREGTNNIIFTSNKAPSLWKCKFYNKNVGIIRNKHVGKPTFLFYIFG